jgi:nicotinamidase-related amidase
MLISAEKSALMVVDVQERLLRHIHGWQAVLENIYWLMQVARKIGVPVMVTEQYPQGLGHTATELAAEFTPAMVGEKVHFSCVAGGCLPALAGADRQQMVLCGIESHVCVMQTAIELREQGKDVFVIGDAVGSRDPQCKELALARMRQHGIEIVAREMVAFEWLRQAGTPLFKEVSSQFLK